MTELIRHAPTLTLKKKVTSTNGAVLTIGAGPGNLIYHNGAGAGGVGPVLVSIIVRRNH
jgi:hypothetical protein